jgi:hypothetical protein
VGDLARRRRAPGRRRSFAPSEIGERDDGQGRARDACARRERREPARRATRRGRRVSPRALVGEHGLAPRARARSARVVRDRRSKALQAG